MEQAYMKTVDHGHTLLHSRQYICGDHGRRASPEGFCRAGRDCDWICLVVGSATPFRCSVLTARVVRSTTRVRCALVSATYSLPSAQERPAGSANTGDRSEPP